MKGIKKLFLRTFDELNVGDGLRALVLGSIRGWERGNEEGEKRDEDKDKDEHKKVEVEGMDRDRDDIEVEDKGRGEGVQIMGPEA